jgi:hypothetical protein
MKNTIQHNNLLNQNFGIFNSKKMQAKIIDFKPDRYHHYTLRLKINNLNMNNFRLVFYNNQLTVILFESIEFNRPVHTHNFKLSDFDDNSFYDEQTTVNFTLPEENFYLIGHKAFPQKEILEVIFGKIHRN